MEFSVKSGSPEKQRSACIVIGVFEPRRLSGVAEQLDRASKGLRLMPDEITTPVMPAYGSGATLSPELQKEIELFRAKQAEAAAAGRATTQGQ